MIDSNVEGKLLKQAERYQQSGTPLSEIRRLIEEEAITDGVIDSAIVDKVMRRVQRTGTNESHGAMGKAHNPVKRVNKMALLLRSLH